MANPNRRRLKDDTPRRADPGRPWQLEPLEDRVLLSDWGMGRLRARARIRISAAPLPRRSGSSRSRSGRFARPDRAVPRRDVEPGGREPGPPTTAPPRSPRCRQRACWPRWVTRAWSRARPRACFSVLAGKAQALNPAMAMETATGPDDWRIVRLGGSPDAGSSLPMPPPPAFRGAIGGAGSIAFFTFGFRDDPGDMPRPGFRVFLSAVQADLHRDKAMIGQSPDQEPSPTRWRFPRSPTLPPLFSPLRVQRERRGGRVSALARAGGPPGGDPGHPGRLPVDLDRAAGGRPRRPAADDRAQQRGVVLGSLFLATTRRNGTRWPRRSSTSCSADRPRCRSR